VVASALGRCASTNTRVCTGLTQLLQVLLKQIANAMIIVLILAMALSFGVRDWVEAGVITAVIIINITIGFFQEYRA